MKKFSLQHLIPPTLLLGLSAFFSRIIGVYRDHLLAKTFGATAGTGIYDLDVYYAAFRIPDLTYTLLVLGVVSAAFIPIFTQYKKKHQMQEAWAFASSVFHLLLMVVLGLTILLYGLAPYLAPLIAPGFSAEQLELMTQVMRILLWSPLIFSASAVLVALQDSFKAFFLRSLAPLFYNAGIILGILYFAPEFGVGGVAAGVVIGAGLQLLIQLPSLKWIGFKYQPVLGYKRADVRKAFKLIIPRILGLSLTQLTLIINTLIASFLITGSITIFYLADNLQAIPLGLIGLAFAITSFATLSELADEPTPEKFAAELRRVMGQVLFLILPATVGLYLIHEAFIEFFLLYGKFTARDAALVSDVFSWLILSLFAQSLIPLLARGFYAYHDTKTPLGAGVGGALTSILGSLFLALYLEMGIVGIAVAFTAGNIFNFFYLLRRMTKKTRAKLIDLSQLFRMLIASMGMGVAVHLTKQMVPFGGSFAFQVAVILFYLGMGTVVYFGLAWALKLPQVKIFVKC